MNIWEKGFTYLHLYHLTIVIGTFVLKSLEKQNIPSSYSAFLANLPSPVGHPVVDPVCVRPSMSWAHGTRYQDGGLEGLEIVSYFVDYRLFTPLSKPLDGVLLNIFVTKCLGKYLCLFARKLKRRLRAIPSLLIQSRSVEVSRKNLWLREMCYKREYFLVWLKFGVIPSLLWSPVFVPSGGFGWFDNSPSPNFDVSSLGLDPRIPVNENCVNRYTRTQRCLVPIET